MSIMLRSLSRSLSGLTSHRSVIQQSLRQGVAVQSLISPKSHQFHSSSFLLAHQGDHIHRDSPDNNADTPFDFTPEHYEKIDMYLKRYPDTPQGRQSAIMPLLWLVLRQNDNWVPLAAMNKIASLLGCPPMQVYEVATFYTMYNRKPVGKYFIQLCATTPCMITGAYDVMDAIMKHLNIKNGETSEDGLFTLLEVECLGACSNAPMVQINDDFYEDLTVENTILLLDNLKNGNPVKIGPQNDRPNAVGPQGKTCLIGEPTGPYAPNLA